MRECGRARGGVTLDLFCVAICFSIVFRLYVMMIIKTVLALCFQTNDTVKLIINEWPFEHFYSILLGNMSKHLNQRLNIVEG